MVKNGLKNLNGMVEYGMVKNGLIILAFFDMLNPDIFGGKSCKFNM
jgi:hypothetical protein